MSALKNTQKAHKTGILKRNQCELTVHSPLSPILGKTHKYVLDAKMKIAQFKKMPALLLLSTITALPFTGTVHSSELIRVFMNHARILKFDAPVSSVIVGNAEVADVTVSDPQTVILTGKSYGSTNLVILDQEGDAVVDKKIVVSVDEENSIRVFRQVERSVLTCAPVCENQKQ